MLTKKIIILRQNIELSTNKNYNKMFWLGDKSKFKKMLHRKPIYLIQDSKVGNHKYNGQLIWFMKKKGF